MLPAQSPPQHTDGARGLGGKARETRPRGGYRASLFGALAGAVIGGVGGAFFGTLYVDLFVLDPYRISVLTPYAALAVIGFWDGAIAGCWLALRWRRHTLRATTAALLGLLTVAPLGYFVYDIPSRGFNLPVLLAAVAFTLTLAPLLSRFLALRLSAVVRTVRARRRAR